MEREWSKILMEKRRWVTKERVKEENVEKNVGVGQECGKNDKGGEME